MTDKLIRGSVRWYSEAEHPLGPPPDRIYEERDGVVYQVPRDTRMWMSIEWAEEHNYGVPDNWRDME